MDKQDAYQLMLMALDQGKVSPAEIVDWLYDNGYDIRSVYLYEDAGEQERLLAAWRKGRKEWDKADGEGYDRGLEDGKKEGAR